MKHLKTYENSTEVTDRDLLLSDVALYLEERQPVSTEDGFIECEFDSDELFCFIFSFWTSEESYDSFYAFLKENKMKVKKEYSCGNRSEKYEIQVKVPEKKIKEFASLYSSSKKYNL